MENVAELIQGLAGLIQPYIVATLIVFAVVAGIRALVVWKVGEEGITSAGWKLAFMLLAAGTGIVAGSGWLGSPGRAGTRRTRRSRPAGRRSGHREQGPREPCPEVPEGPKGSL
jgi:hypothetical protein